ncbi:MAG: exonuclease SbcCD subunit D [Desulfurococcales archaeon]|nr:exonuclease SbcCD subunit D [Desulfurococcales archaeon]
MTVRILHLADTHLGARPYGFKERELDIIESFDQALDYAFEERPDLIVIAGDLFDKPKPDNHILGHAVRRIKNITSRGIPVVAAHGDHDTPGRRGATILQVLESAIDGFYAPLPPEGSGPSGIVESQILRIKGVGVIVYPFVKVDLDRRRELARRLLPLFSSQAARMEKPRVFVGHFSLDNVFPLDSVASPQDLPPVEYAALGHVHFRYKGDGDRVYAYTGVLDPLNIAEARSKGIRGPILVDIDGDGASLQDLPVETRPHFEADVEIEDPSQVVVKLKIAIAGVVKRDGGKPPLVYIRARVSPKVPLRLLFDRASRIAGSMGLLIKVVHERIAEESRGVVVASERISPLDVLTRDLRLPESTARMVMELVNALLGDDDEASKDVVIGLLDKLSSQEKLLERWAR